MLGSKWTVNVSNKAVKSLAKIPKTKYKDIIYVEILDIKKRDENTY